jgi:uncharacterized membrane protein YebE (DUF533 family)
MTIQNLFNQFLGSSSNSTATGNTVSGITDSLGRLTSNIPGGLAGGAAAGGIMALLMNNKSARKFAGKAATYGGAAVLGGLAYKAFQNWQRNGGEYDNAAPAQIRVNNEKAFVEDALQPAFELKLIQAMIAAARADGHIDESEQGHIFNAVERMEMSNEMKGKVFDLMRQPISIADLVQGVENIEQKSELYLASCLVMNPDHAAELAHLDELARALSLPAGLAQQLQSQASQAMLDDAA